ncbi:MAG: uracil phosphoribosyltransferase [Defluviitaleaceae bacterium]|nr:uracil phosphoribosyltransferase [Defluviitaleaceae bacterium]
MENVYLVENPLVDHYVGVIRDEKTEKNEFSNAIENIVYLMSSKITGDVALSHRSINTPMAETTVAYFFDKILIVPILRAGLAMFEPIRKVMPHSTSGYIGIKRNPDTSAQMYYENLPADLHGYRVILLEVVIATGNTLDFAINHLINSGVNPEKISIASIISSRKGLENLMQKYPGISAVTCAIDEILDENGMIIPGLGDAGDRYNGY